MNKKIKDYIKEHEEAIVEGVAIFGASLIGSAIVYKLGVKSVRIDEELIITVRDKDGNLIQKLTSRRTR